MGISGGMVRLKGNSPKVSGKDSNRPRSIKQYGQQNMPAGVGGIGSIGNIASSNIPGSQYGVRTIQSQKGINRPQTNNLMMSQQVMGSSHLGQVANQGFANSQILNQQQLGIFKTGGPVRATAFEYKMDHFGGGHNGMQSSSGQMIGGRKNVGGAGHNSQKTYKRGGGSMGPS